MKKSNEIEKNSATTKDFYGIKQASEKKKSDEIFVSNGSSAMMMEGGSVNETPKLSKQVSIKQVKFLDVDP